jgi:hypothetical protein
MDVNLLKQGFQTLHLACLKKSEISTPKKNLSNQPRKSEPKYHCIMKFSRIVIFIAKIKILSKNLLFKTCCNPPPPPSKVGNLWFKGLRVTTHLTVTFSVEIALMDIIGSCKGFSNFLFCIVSDPFKIFSKFCDLTLLQIE